MAKQKESGKQRDRKPLSRAETFHLWMVCGGICSFDGCNERLVTNTKGKLTNIGIAAHIIGHSDGGARHEFAEQFGFQDENLEDVRNLMLMCYTHSKLIDDAHTKDSFPPELLFEMKEKHEAWVRNWTDDKKKSLAIVHKRLGPPLVTLPLTENTPHVLLEALELQTEFYDYSKEGWRAGQIANEKLYSLFVTKTGRGLYDVAEVYPLSPIPLLIHLGKLLSDTIPLTIYQYERDQGVWVNCSPKDLILEPLNPNTTFIDNNANELVVTISISDSVTDEDVLGVLAEGTFNRFDIRIDNPHIKRLIYKEQVQEIQKLYKDQVEKLHREKRYGRIHLLYCGPAGLAIEIGRSVNPRMWPEVSLYQFNYRETPRYQFALNI